MQTNRISIIAIILAAISLTASGQDANDIFRRMESNMRGDASYTEMTMEIVKPGYTREISLNKWSLGDSLAFIYVTAPARNEGTSFMKRGNEIWNHVPGIDRTVRMPPSMMSQSWMGSDFTNDDILRGVSVIEDYGHELAEKETIDGMECYKIELSPHPKKPVVFKKIIYWVSIEYLLPVKVENYDEYGDLVSTINFMEMKTLGSKLVPSVIEMIPVDKSGQKTILTYHEADFDIDLSENFFSRQNLTKIRYNIEK